MYIEQFLDVGCSIIPTRSRTSYRRRSRKIVNMQNDFTESSAAHIDRWMGDQHPERLIRSMRIPDSIRPYNKDFEN